MASVARVVRCLAQGRARGATAACRRKFLVPCQRLAPVSSRQSSGSSSQSSLLWEPVFNDEPEIPEYPPLNIRLRSYDYVLLESYHRYVSKLTKILNLETTCWPVPARTTHVVTYKYNSTVVESEYDLAKYERTVQVEGLPSTLAPILFETLQRNLPQGMWFTVKEPDPEEEEFRYVPDLMVQELQAKIQELDQVKDDRRK